MNPAFLDINDTSLSLTTADEVVSSPGAVLSDAGTLHFGEYAVSQLKRRPLDVKSDYWSQLSTAPLSAQFGSARHTADLVYEHLKSLIPHPERLHDLCIIAPSNMNQTQLELLLGILSALNIEPRAVIDRALIAHAGQSAPGVNLSLQWRQLVVTELEQIDQRLSVHKTTAIPGLGYLDLLEDCLEHVADACVAQTRFDPRRSAASEQTLLSAIPGLLASQTDDNELSVEVESYTFKVARDALKKVGQRVLDAVNTDGRSISVDASLSVFPGIVFNSVTTQESLTEAASAVLSGTTAQAPLSRITSCALSTDVRPEPSRIQQPRSQTRSSDLDTATRQHNPPTHLLIDATAHV
ncbi:hypothetical protein OAU03_02390, partial [Luminiphilus sp.]|nr:hypothetical protein [Luminiphilus sp.]